MSKPHFPPSLGALLATLFFFAGCGGGPPPQAPGPPVVTVAAPVEQAVTDHVDFSGKTAAVESVELRARVGGYLDKADYKEGNEVKTDQVLFAIDPRPYQAELDRAQARVKATQAEVAEAESAYERAARLRPSGAISAEEYEKALRTRDVAVADVDAARANVAVKRLNLDFTKVLAPIDGRADKADVTPGNLVSANLIDATVLTNIVRLDPMYVYFDVGELTGLQILRQIREGRMPSREEKGPGLQPAPMAVAAVGLPASSPWSRSLSAGIVIAATPRYPVDLGLGNEGEDYPHKGYIDFVGNQFDPSTGTISVRGVFPNKDRALAPGLSARVRVPLGGPHPALLVSDRALGTDRGQKFLYVLDGKNQVEERPVTVGALHGGLREVVDGLKPGERVVINGLLRVRTGVTVEPKPGEMRPEPADE
jgi:RND family efflux transporter MFP subunit